MTDLAEHECPICRHNMLQIIYGYPDAETLLKARRGEIVLGGCILRVGRPSHECEHCGTKAMLVVPGNEATPRNHLN